MRYTNSLHYDDGALKGQQWPRLAPIFILILVLIFKLVSDIEGKDALTLMQYLRTINYVVIRTRTRVLSLGHRPLAFQIRETHSSAIPV